MAMAISPETAKKNEEVNSKEKEDQWIQVQKSGKPMQGSRKKVKPALGDSATGSASISQVVNIPKDAHNPFVVLNSSETILEEGKCGKWK